MFARLNRRELAHDAIPFHHHGLTLVVCDHPFSALDVHRLRAVIVNGDKVIEPMRLVFRSRGGGRIDHPIHADAQTFELDELLLHWHAERLVTQFEARKAGRHPQRGRRTRAAGLASTLLPTARCAAHG